MAKRTKKQILGGLIASLLLATGCMLPLQGGNASFMTPGGAGGTVQQPQNPKDESTQIWEREADGTERITTKIGAAQKDVAREMAAKLSSLKWVTWVGVLVFLFGAASLFYPPLKLIVGSVTTSVAACVAGLALIVLPIVIVGNELLIFGVAIGGVVIYWFSHRHGKLQGFIDANKDGVDDRTQK